MCAFLCLSVFVCVSGSLCVCVSVSVCQIPCVLFESVSVLCLYVWVCVCVCLSWLQGVKSSDKEGSVIQSAEASSATFRRRFSFRTRSWSVSLQKFYNFHSISWRIPSGRNVISFHDHMLTLCRLILENMYFHSITNFYFGAKVIRILFSLFLSLRYIFLRKSIVSFFFKQLLLCRY